MHLRQMGDTGPAVIFDSALGGTCLSWTLVQPEVAKFAQAFTYDRAGFGWSDPAPAPRTSANIVDELRSLLREAAVAPPYILCGHSFGGLNMRVYAGTYPAEVAGLVLVDAATPEEWLEPSPANRVRLQRGAALARRGEWLARMGVTRLVSAIAASGALSVARSTVGWITGGAIRNDHSDRILAPMTKLPSELHPVLRSMWVEPKFFATLAGQMEQLPVSARQGAGIRSLGNLPLAVVVAGNATEQQRQWQDCCSSLSTQSRLFTAHTSGHWIPMDEPGTIVEAVRDVASRI
jgi:pimeloyl-ACP methyl ester carboxylesterase